MKLEIKIPKSLKKIPVFLLNALTEKPIWCLLFLVLLLFSYLVFLFYFLVLKTPPPVSENKVEIKMGVYQQVIDRLNQRATNLQQGIAKDYPNIFK